MEKDKIVVFGGAFNPPLNSHFSLAQHIINEYEDVEKVIFVPVNSKYNKDGLISNEHRYNMLKIICDKNKDFEVSTIEIDNERPLYTIETLEKIQSEYNDKTIFFTIGSDNLKELAIWENADKLVNKFKILVLERDDDNTEQIISSNKFLNEHKSSFICVKNNLRSRMSSSFVRNKIKNGKSIRYLTPDEVYNYIIENNLFK